MSDLINNPEFNKEKPPTPEMTSTDVVDFYNACTETEIDIWLDGGWSVDALLGEQIREHVDLDIAIQEKDVSQFRKLMTERGYQEIKLEQARHHNFVLGDNQGHEIDVHVIVLDEQGNGIYGPPQHGDMYPAESLTGKGTIGGTEVKCISPQAMVEFLAPWISKHPQKYVPAISALCEKFNLPIPQEFVKYQSSKNP